MTPPSDPTAVPVFRRILYWCQRRITESVLALTFLSRIPVPLPPFGPERAYTACPPLAASHWALPVVGAGLGIAVGLLLAGLIWVGLAPWQAAALALGAGLWITGALHEDGAADCADALGVRGDAERKLAAMKDSGIGSFGTLALILTIGIRFGAYWSLALAWHTTSIGIGAVLIALGSAGALARVASLGVLLRLSPARATGLGAAAKTTAESHRPAWIGMTLGGGATAVVLTLSEPWSWEVAVLGLVACMGLTLWICAWARRALGGQTGDVAGAAAIATECAVLILMTAQLTQGSP